MNENTFDNPPLPQEEASDEVVPNKPEELQRPAAEFLFVPPPVKKEEPKPAGRLPQMGATGTWKTPLGYINGKVVSGQAGGPYMIEDTSGRRTRVDNIL